MKYNQEVSNALQHARGLVGQGWCQGSFVAPHPDGRTKYCVVGALQVAALGSGICLHPNETYLECLSLLWQQLIMEKASTTSYLDLQEFNDRLGRTQAEVLALFDQVLTEITK